MAGAWKGIIAVAALLVLAAASLALAESLGRTLLPLEGAGSRVRESTLGDLLADAERAQFPKADLAVLEAGQFRPGTLPAGDLTEKQLADLLFFPDEPVVLVELKASSLQAVLERGLSFLPQRSAAFLQVSGISVTYRSAAPTGHRVAEAQVGEAPLDPGRSYLVAMPSSLQKGGLGYFRVLNVARVVETGPSVSEVLSRYVRTTGTISIKPGARLRDLSRPAPATAPAQ